VPVSQSGADPIGEQQSGPGPVGGPDTLSRCAAPRKSHPGPQPARVRRPGESVLSQGCGQRRAQVSGAQFTLVTGSALLLGASYQGVAQVPTASGKAVPMMGVHHELADPGRRAHADRDPGRVSSVTSGSSMQFTGSVVLYATELSGDLLGSP
jgi:hypothetical protein